MKNVNLEFIYMDNVKKGHLTVMWNILFDKAIEDNNDYFFQCGDDIEFHTKGWVNDCISVLKNTDGIGLVGPINNNPRILTQSFVQSIRTPTAGNSNNKGLQRISNARRFSEFELILIFELI